MKIKTSMKAGKDFTIMIISEPEYKDWQLKGK